VEPGRDIVTVDGKPLAAEKKYYILLYKPRGIVTTMEDPEGRKTVRELVADIPARLYPVGRLDYNTEGLLLLTNDGPLTHTLTHPSHNISKTYLAEVVGKPTLRRYRLASGLPSVRRRTLRMHRVRRQQHQRADQQARKDSAACAFPQPARRQGARGPWPEAMR